MKKNDYLLLAATGAYSFLFYQQNAGINFLLFTVILLGILLLRDTALLKNKKWLWCAGMCLISAVSVFINSSALSVIANVFSLLLLSAVSFNATTSSLFSFIFSCYSVISVAVYMIIDSVKRLKSNNGTSSDKKGHRVMATFLVLLLSIMFFNMYKSSNPLFAENTKWINLDFISFNWICFTISGCLLTYAFLYHRVIKPVQTWENNLPLLNNPGTVNEQNKKQLETERYSGLLLFALLNLMLVVLNAGDIQTLYFNGGLPKNITHSDFVHSGVGIIILSIILATSLIMYLFRKEFMDVKNNKGLMFFVYLWIAQNLLMLSSTAMRNQIYIHDFNFTYKRIGVYVWLTLAAFGLLIMLWKIFKKRSNWYLIRTNVAVWFTTLVLSSIVNWDKLITTYNIQNKPLSQVDFYYLFSLSDANIPELKTLSEKSEFKKIYSLEKALLKRYNKELENLNSAASYRDNKRYMELQKLISQHDNLFRYGDSYIDLLNRKIEHYLSDYTNDWRSFDLRDHQIVKSIYKK